MKKLTVDILCPGDYMDSYESRIYFNGEANSLEEAFKWAEEQLPEINTLDEIHGRTFFLYIEGQMVATINKNDSECTIDKDEKSMYKLYLYLTDKDAYFELLEKELKEFMSFMSV